jgi:hypothetical protein
MDSDSKTTAGSARGAAVSPLPHPHPAANTPTTGPSGVTAATVNGSTNDVSNNGHHGDTNGSMLAPSLPSPNGHTDYSSLASMLEPALIAACDGDLSDIQWFRSTWQSGGAATAKAKFALTNGRSAHVIVKLPIGPAEYLWTTGMEGLDAPEGPHCELEYGCTPRVFAAGPRLGGYDLAWIVVERLNGQPLSHHFNGAAAQDLLTAAVNWYERAANLRQITPTDRPAAKDWVAQLARARESAEDNAIAEEARWIAAIERAQRVLPWLVETWESRPLTAWCHGDMHPGNAMRRVRDGEDVAQGQCVLIDLALVHAGHWVEDAVYLERLCWPKPEILGGVKPVEFVADLLRTRGLMGDEDYRTLATVRRVLMAATSPAYLAQDGNPRYMHAALEKLEEGLGEFGA